MFETVVPTFEKWEKKPLDDPAWKDSKGVLGNDFYEEMKRAAFRRDAHWEYPIGGGSSLNCLGFFWFPDIQGSRTISFGMGLVGPGFGTT